MPRDHRHAPIPRIALIALLALAACSPTYNWREVRTPEGGLKALLPCKPDQGTRTQNLGTQVVEVQMLGCEAGGALYAIAAASVGAQGQAGTVLSQWQARTLENMRTASPRVSPFALAGAAQDPAPVSVRALGVGPDGRAVTLQAVWFARGDRVYQAALYAETVREEQSEPFFSGLALP